MDNATYTTLNRQSGLLREMSAVANNIANLSTTGFRKEGVIFAEFVADLEGSEPSLSMASAEGRIIDLAQGPLTRTGGTFDFAIEGEGFFMIETPDGNQLTRAGSFTPSPEGELLTPDGYRLLDTGGGPVFAPTDAGDLTHRGGTRFAVAGPVDPVEGGSLFQGFLENSNVNAVEEITRMIEVQRAYEMGQGFLDSEDQRIRSVIQTFGR